MRQVSPFPVWSAIRHVLTRDTLVLLYLAVVVTEALVYSLPLLDPGTLTAFGASPFQIPFVTTAALAGFYGLGRVQDAEERIFWRNLAYACVFWLATLVAIALVPAAQWRWVDDVWVDAAYLFFYSPILFAAECKPHLAGLGPKRDVERQLRWAGVTILVSGWFLYFVVAPAIADPTLFGTMLPSSLLFVTVDAAIVIRFVWRARVERFDALARALRRDRPRGRVAAATDALDALEGLRWYALPDGAKTDLLWAFAPFFLLLAFRLREADLPRAVDAATGERAARSGLDPVRVGSFLVGSAFSFPLVHFALHTWLSFGERLAAYQRIIVVGRAGGPRRAGGGRVRLPGARARGRRSPPHGARGAPAARAGARGREPDGGRGVRRVSRHAQERRRVRRSRHRRPRGRRPPARRRGAGRRAGAARHGIRERPEGDQPAGSRAPGRPRTRRGHLGPDARTAPRARPDGAARDTCPPASRA